MDEYQRRGLGTITSLALVEHALTHGIQRVGWHCWKWNVPSSALALHAGFEHVRDYPVELCIFNLGVQFAMQAYDARLAGDIPAALDWYRQALAAGSAPAWAYYEAARCMARLEQPEEAITALGQAVEHGFDNFSAARSEPDFEGLKQHPTWNTIIPAQ
jgi:tetratricopeptide (TPR) repeat protein